MEWAKNGISQKWDEPKMEWAIIGMSQKLNEPLMEWAKYGVRQKWNEPILEWAEFGIAISFFLKGSHLLLWSLLSYSSDFIGLGNLFKIYQNCIQESYMYIPILSKLSTNFPVHLVWIIF